MSGAQKSGRRWARFSYGLARLCRYAGEHAVVAAGRQYVRTHDCGCPVAVVSAQGSSDLAMMADALLEACPIEQGKLPRHQRENHNPSMISRRRVLPAARTIP